MGSDTSACCSVIIPAYNVEGYVAEAIESAMAQTYEAVEVVVVNDGSTDGTTARIEPFLDRVVYVDQENRGLAGARNAGIRASTGEIIGLLDGDDIWMPERVARCVEILERNPRVGFVTTDAWTMRDREPTEERFFGPNRRFPDGDYARAIVRRNFLFGSVIARRSLYEEVGLFDESLRAVEDYDMWLRFIAAGADPALVDEPLAYYRTRAGSLTGDRPHIRESRLQVLENRLPEFWDQGIYGNAHEAWAVGLRVLERGGRRQALRFFLAAARDDTKPLHRRARTVLAGLLRSALSGRRWRR